MQSLSIVDIAFLSFSTRGRFFRPSLLGSYLELKTRIPNCKNKGNYFRNLEVLLANIVSPTIKPKDFRENCNDDCDNGFVLLSFIVRRRRTYRSKCCMSVSFTSANRCPPSPDLCSATYFFVYYQIQNGIKDLLIFKFV